MSFSFRFSTTQVMFWGWWGFGGGGGFGFFFCWFVFGLGGGRGGVLKILLSVALPQAERNMSVPCPVQKAKAISSTQIWGPLQAILRPVVN